VFWEGANAWAPGVLSFCSQREIHGTSFAFSLTLLWQVEAVTFELWREYTLASKRDTSNVFSGSV
jgi:hypothetical protein